MRLDSGGRSLGYSADSGPGWSLEALGPGIDLALCEATFLQDREGTVQHLSARRQGRRPRRPASSRLVLTHIVADARRRALAGPRARRPSADRSTSPPSTRVYRGLTVSRRDGRKPDDLRPLDLRSRLHRVRGRVGARVHGPHQGAVHRVGRGARPAVDARHRAGLGHGRILDAAGVDGRARRPGGGQGQAVRSHPGDPAADRPIAARRHRPQGRRARSRW